MSTPGAEDIKTANASVASFVSVLIANGAVAVAFYSAFTILRKRYPLIYAPRTFLVKERFRSSPLAGLFSWLSLPFRNKDEELIRKIGPDNWAVIYYMRWMFRYFAIIALVGIVILFPTYATGNVGNVGLDRLTIGNVGEDQSARLWGTLFLTWLFVALTLFVIYKLVRTSSGLRHKFILSSDQRDALSGYTLVVRDIPHHLRDPVILRQLFERIQPHKVLDVIITRDVSKLSKIHKKHVSNRDALEKSTCTYFKNVVKGYQKRNKTSGKQQHTDLNAETAGSAALSPEDMGNDKRPTHKSKFVIGHKVDSITQYTKELREQEAELTTERSAIYASTTRYESAAFIIFADLFAPHVAALANIHGTPGTMDSKQACVDPDDVIWDNLNMPMYQRQVRGLISLAACIALIIFWGTITTFLSSISNLDNLTKQFAFLDFLDFFDDLPPVVKGVVQGLLPTVLIVILFSLLPMILRFISKFSGVMTETAIERTLIQQYYFFLVFNVLLIVTISGSIFITIGDIIKNPSLVFEILANSLPGVSTFFVNYITLRALSGPAGELLQIANLIIKPLMLKFMAGTPRAIWTKSQPMLFKSGVVLANHSFIATVGLTYMTLAPLVSIVTMVYFAMYLLVYHHQMPYVYDSRNQTGGLYLFSAAKQLFVGLYIHQIIILGLFLLKKAWVQTALIAVVFAITCFANRYINQYNKLMLSVPAKAAYDESKNRKITMKSSVAKEFISNEPWRNEVDIGTATPPVTNGNTIHPRDHSQQPNTVSPQAGYFPAVVQSNNLTDPAVMSTQTSPTADEFTRTQFDPRPSTTSTQHHPREGTATTQSSGGEENYTGPDDYEKKFLHPALRPDALIVWLPADAFGLEPGVQQEIESGCPRGLVVSTEGAYMDEQGKISVTTDMISHHKAP
ncbi:hypothetical protein DFS34DRAFT_628547 [Phlyctochytrium arcticum]|nr:hypothetical protein DFS34DRAFT_628547 [Phlyctochytrium arcticum]